MTFPTFVFRDVQMLAAALRAKLCRAPAGFSVARPTYVAPSPQVRPLAHWRICPATGQLVQHWDHADPQDPQRPMVSSLAHAGLMLGFYLSTRAA
ncbi:hypothetical protein PspS35_15180 [Pseudomonas sp. S35]|uniref:hypothetical protein n=1 Tax=Pseudomonas sp. S35 TaxID=1573719 RepID=UPI00132F4855|nr:hypothetical protein [Pseudomonas sp. S35]QHF45057.1 hypothetical protein PspS35_15180 [Pseudomonas sp. S35]